MIPSQVMMKPFLFRNQNHQKKVDEAVADKTESNTSFQPVDLQKKFVISQTPLQVLSELSSTIQEMKSQNESSIN